MPQLILNKLMRAGRPGSPAIAPLLEAVPYTQGPNNSHLYESAQALAAIYRCRHKDGGPGFTLAEAKIRNELAAAKLREVTLSQKLEELSAVFAPVGNFDLDSFGSVEYVRLNMNTYFRRLWARLRQKFGGESQQLELNLWTRRTRR